MNKLYVCKYFEIVDSVDLVEKKKNNKFPNQIRTSITTSKIKHIGDTLMHQALTGNPYGVVRFLTEKKKN